MQIRREVKVGLFAVISLTILIIGFNYLKGIDLFTNTNKYYTIYDDVAGLAVSNPVKINGYSVGRVSDIDILQEQNNQIIVEMDIDDRIELGKGTYALLQIDILGSVSIILDAGDINNLIQPGDTVESRVDPSLEALVKESALPVANNLNVTIRNLNQILDSLSSNMGTISRSLENVEGITYQMNALLAKNEEAFSGTIQSLPSITSNLNSNLDSLSALLGKFNNLADSLLIVDLKSTTESLNSTIDNLDKTLAALNEGEGTMGKLFKNDSLYNNLNKTITDLDSLLIHMNSYPKHFFAPLGKSRKKIEKDLEKEK